MCCVHGLTVDRASSLRMMEGECSALGWSADVEWVKSLSFTPQITHAHTHTYMYTHSSRSVADATQPITKVLVSKQLSSQPSKSSRHNQTLKGHKSPDGLKPMRDIFRTMPILSLARDVELQLRRTVGLNNAFPYVNSWGEYTCASEKVGNRVKRSSINC